MKFEKAYNTGVIANNSASSLNLQNSLYDPVVASSNDSVRDFVGIKYLYKRFWVYGMKVTVTYQNLSSSPLHAVMWGRDDSLLSITIADALELRDTVSRVLGPKGSANDRVTISKYFHINKIYGKQTENDELFSHGPGANQGSPMYISVTSMNLSGASSDAGVYTDVKVMYYYKAWNAYASHGVANITPTADTADTIETVPADEISAP